MKIEQKRYPLNYPSDVMEIISAMSYDVHNVNIVGSMSLKSQLYAGDYDMTEKVENNTASSKEVAVEGFAHGLQSIVSRLLRMPDVWIGDIKCGEIPDWKVVRGDVRDGKVVGYSSELSKDRLQRLYREHIINEEEYMEAKKWLIPDPTAAQFLEIQKEVRPEILRWKPADILRGKLVLRNKTFITLANAIATPSLTKLDVVGLVQNNRFTDFSIIYSFIYRGIPVNPSIIDQEAELKKNVLYYMKVGEYFKMMKRIFALSKRTKSPLNEELTEVFNGDLGRLYSIISDIGSVLFLLENESIVPISKLHYEISQFRARLGNIYETDRVNTERTLKEMVALEEADRPHLKVGLEQLQEKLSKILNTEAKKELMRLKLYPVPDKFLP